MKRRTIGLDPGAKGAITCIWENDKQDVWKYSDMQGAKEVLEGIIEEDSGVSITAYLEEPATQVFLPGGQVMHAAKLQRSLGRLEGLLLALGIKTYLVKPKDWQKGISGLAGAKGYTRKVKLREHAARLFPALKLTNDTADSLLIAEWGRRQP
jgi:hypothetical protein